MSVTCTGQHQNPSQAGVQAIGQGEINNAVFSAERDSRLGAVLGQRVQSIAGNPGPDDCQGVFNHVMFLHLEIKLD